MLYVGLTGGIAAGKTAVARRLAASGCAVLDLDRVAHEVMAPAGAAHAGVVAAFGPDVLAADGSIDRKRLGARVFADRAEIERLNAIVHPIVRGEEARRVASFEAAGAEVVVSEAALLIETGLHLRFDRLIVADCSPEQQRLRLQYRSGLSSADAQSRLDSQMSRALRVSFAHRVVDTSGSIEESQRSATLLAQELLALARRSWRPLGSREQLLAALAIAAPSPDSFAARFIEHVVQAGALDLRGIARVFGHAGEPWYEPEAGSRHAPIELALPVIVHLLQRPFADDPDLLASAMASVGRALGNDPNDWADGCMLGVAVAQLLVGGTSPLVEPWPELVSLAQRWAGAAPRASSAARAEEIALRLAAGVQTIEIPAPLRELFERLLALTR